MFAILEVDYTYSYISILALFQPLLFRGTGMATVCSVCNVIKVTIELAVVRFIIDWSLNTDSETNTAF